MAVTTLPLKQPNRRRYRQIRKAVVVYGGLTFFAILAGLPIYWMVITTFKPDRDLYNLANFPLWFNQNGITFDHLALLFNKTGFPVWVRNTVIVSVAVPVQRCADSHDVVGVVPAALTQLR